MKRWGLQCLTKQEQRKWRYRLKAGGKWRCEDPLLIFSTDRVAFVGAEEQRRLVKYCNAYIYPVALFECKATFKKNIFSLSRSANIWDSKAYIRVDANASCHGNQCQKSAFKCFLLLFKITPELFDVLPFTLRPLHSCIPDDDYKQYCLWSSSWVHVYYIFTGEKCRKEKAFSS